MAAGGLREITETHVVDLVALHNTTLGRLREIWSDIGLSEEDVSRQIDVLLSEVEKVFSQKVALEETLKDSYISDIATVSEELRRTSIALGQTPEEHVCDENATLAEQLTVVQEKFGAISETKTGRLNVLQALQEDLISITAELGDSLDETYMILGNDDLRDSRVHSFELRLMEAKAEWDARRTAVQEMLVDITNMERELGLPASPEMVTPPHPAAPGDDAAGQENVTQNQSSIDITTISTQDDKRAAEDAEECGGAAVSVTMDSIELLATRLQDLSLEKKTRLAQIQELRSCIEPIWDRLQINEVERTSFLDSAPGITDTDIDAHHTELCRMKALKKARLVPLVTETRLAITALWDEMGCGEEERVQFEPMLTGGGEGVREEVLDLLDQMLEGLKGRAVKMRPLLRLAEKREALLAKRQEIESMSHDPSRLVSRSSNARKLLLEEERARNSVKKLPVLNARLRKEIAEWERTHSEPFKLNGRPYLETLEESEAAWTRERRSSIVRPPTPVVSRTRSSTLR